VVEGSCAENGEGGNFTNPTAGKALNGRYFGLLEISNFRQQISW
jgi:hypothetical protein